LGQRDLTYFREEVEKPGQYAGGIGWDSVPIGTEVANSQGVDMNIIGLPFEVNVLSITNNNPIDVIEWEQSPPDPTAAGSTSGTHLISHLDRSSPSEWFLDFEISEGY